MIYFDLNRKEIFWHAGIPRTATRTTSDLLGASGYKAMGNSELLYNGHETLHLRLDVAKDMFSKMKLAELDLWDFVDDFPEKQFGVVRHPLEKFKSAAKSLYLENFDINSYEDFVFFMERQFSTTIPKEEYEDAPRNIFYGYKNSFNGWFEHQCNFVEDQTHIWKFEDGFGKNYVEWLNDVVGIRVIDNQTTYEKQEYDDNVKEKSSIPSNILEYAKQYYRKDYIRFGYNFT